MPQQSPAESHSIVFFDGVCAVCNSTVDFLLERDTESQLRFAPLQGETAAEFLPAADVESLHSLVFFDGQRLWRRSAAVSRILRRLKAPWPLLGWMLWLIPLPVRELGYRIVARYRYRWFGKKETCRLPSPEERGRILA